MKDVIVGLGNTIVSDDGIGIWVAEKLKADYQDIDISQALYSGYYLLDYIFGYDRAIFVDSIKTEKNPVGDVSLYRMSDFKNRSRTSIHSTDLISAIETARLYGMDVPEHIYFIGIEILDNITFQESFTPEVESLKESIYMKVKEKIEEIMEEIMSEKDLMQKIADSNKSVISGIDASEIEHWVDIYYQGRKFTVPAAVTIMQALEFAGMMLVHSCGCRAGFCGACATIYRVKGDYKLRTSMACQTKVEDGMYLVQIPFSPAEKANYDINEEKYEDNTLLKIYPSIARCVSCNTCSKACPQDIKVMDYVNAAIRGDYKRVAELSFDCIQCGLCAMRCPADIVQYHVGQLARRMYGKYGRPNVENTDKAATAVEAGDFNEEFKKIFDMTPEEVKELYVKNMKDKESA